jgi:hypothetical protein
MKRRYFLPVIILVVVVLIFARHWTKKNDPGAHLPVATNSSANPMIAAIGSVEQAARQEAANRLAQMEPAPAHRGVGKFSAEMLQQVEDRFRGMIAFRGLITQEKERRVLAQQILAMPDSSDLMREILLDPAFAKEAFGPFQAEARFYAITVLDEVAKQGNLDLVVDVAADLADQMAAVAGEPDPGRSEDLMAVAAIVGRSAGSQALQDDDSPVVAKLADISRPVRAVYVKGLFQGVWKGEGLEEAQAVANHLKTL